LKLLHGVSSLLFAVGLPVGRCELIGETSAHRLCRISISAVKMPVRVRWKGLGDSASADGNQDWISDIFPGENIFLKPCLRKQSYVAFFFF
jgi:hypothetical protein